MSKRKHKGETYQKLNAWHKLRYNFYYTMNGWGIGRIPAEYWEPVGEEAKRYMEECGYRLTKRGWIDR